MMKGEEGGGCRQKFPVQALDLEACLCLLLVNSSQVRGPLVPELTHSLDQGPEAEVQVGNALQYKQSKATNVCRDP